MMPPDSTYQPDMLLQTKHITPELIAYVVDKIVRGVSPKQIVLFGSYARNRATESSDLDLLVVQDGRTSNRQIRREIEILLWGRRFGVDLIVRRPEEVAYNMADGNPFYTRHVFGEGRVLYERPAATSS
jgi:predicted nucleotidyltransferase